MVKTRDLFNKIKDTKRTFHAKMGTIKDRNGMDLTEAEEVKRSVKNTEKNYTEKYFNDPDNHNGVITHLEPDILECKVKWVIIMNKASGDDEISAELFQILKDDAIKVLHSVYQQIWKTQQWPQAWKRSVYILFPKKVKSLSCVQLFVTPWTVAYQAPPSMDFPGKSTGVGCHCLLRDRTWVSHIAGK